MVNAQKETLRELLRLIRRGHRLTQAQAAGLAGVKQATWGNAESSSHAVLGKRRIEAFCDALKLDRALRLRVMEAHAATPLSEFSKKRRERWDQQRAEREKLLSAEAIKAELDLAVARLAPIENALRGLLHCNVLDESMCGCNPDGVDGGPPFVCELCTAMRALGCADGWVSPEAAERFLEGPPPDDFG